jgi:hypothetical protein
MFKNTIKLTYMKIIEINNKHYQECDVVMLKSNKASKYWLDNDKLSQYNHPQRLGSGGTPVEFYILSNEEIKENNWYIHKQVNNLRLLQHSTNNLPLDAKKVIATTDSSLNLGIQKGKIYLQQFKNTKYEPNIIPQIPQQFIEHFITEYNKGNVISKVLVEWLRGSDGYYDEKQVWHWKMLGPLVYPKNNEISILTEQKQETVEEAAEDYYKQFENLPVVRFNAFIAGAKWQAERMYSREEVIELLYKHTEDMFKNKINLETWIKENLKK